MRLAILADIHGNIPALEAALLQIKQDAVDGIVVAGDMVVGPNSVEVIRRLRELEARMIRGNNENYILLFASGEAPDWWHTAQQWSFMRWNYQRIDEETLDFLKDLPEQLTIGFPGTDPIRVVHGSPRNASESIHPETDKSALEAALAIVSEPVLVLAHTHEAWQMRLNGRLAFNPGSVCSTFTGKAGGSYAILSWENSRWEAHHQDIDYDITLARKAFEDSGMLKEVGAFAERWLHDIENGTNHIQGFVDYAYQLAAKAGYPNSPFVPDDIWNQANEQFKIELAKG